MGRNIETSEAPRPAPDPARDADRVPGPLRLARRRASSVGEIVAEGLDVHDLMKDESGARRGGGRRAEGGRARSRDPPPLSARILRRPAPAHRDRPRADPEAQADRAGRADLGARHVGAGADRRPAARPAEEARLHLSLHQPRSARDPRHERPRDRDARRQGGGDRHRASRSSKRRSEDYTKALLAAALHLEVAHVEAIRQ